MKVSHKYLESDYKVILLWKCLMGPLKTSDLGRVLEAAALLPKRFVKFDFSRILKLSGQAERSKKLWTSWNSSTFLTICNTTIGLINA